MCRRYRQRPSETIGLTGVVALDFDLAMAAVHHMEEQTRAAELADMNPLAAVAMMFA